MSSCKQSAKREKKCKSTNLTLKIFQSSILEGSQQTVLLVGQKKGPYGRIIDIISYGKEDASNLIEDIFLDKMELQTRIHLIDSEQFNVGLSRCH